MPIGALSVTAGLVTIVFAIVRSDAWGLASAQTLGTLGLGLLLLTIFALQEHRWSAHPLIPMRIFRVRSVSASNLVMVLIGAVMFAPFFFISLYLQQVRG